MLVCPYPTDVLCPNLSLRMLARSHPAQIVEDRFPASLQEGGGKGGGGGGRGVGAAEVTADFFLSYSSLLLLCQGKAVLLEIHNARTNKHMSGP